MSTTVTKRIAGAASGGKTVRVAESPTGSNLTSRIHHLFLLEADEGSGYLLLEGDMSDLETDALKLEGDATVISGTVTKRVPEAVT